MNTNDTCIFIISCQNTRDISEYCINSIKKFWIDNNLKIFVGGNENESQIFDSIYMLKSKKSNWKNETIEQLNIIKNEFSKFKNVILLLDDFIIQEKVNNREIHKIIEIFKNKKLKYLMLKPFEGGLHTRLKILYYRIVKKSKTIEIKKNHPYYYSLQVAIWDIDYLIQSITKSKNIWDFENMNKPSNIKHFSTTSKYLTYKHIIEKGKWDIGSKEMLTRLLNVRILSNREEINYNNFELLIRKIQKIKFVFFGYTCSRKYTHD